MHLLRKIFDRFRSIKRRSIVLQSAAYSALLCSAACLILFIALFHIQRGIYERRLVTDAEENIAKVTTFLLGYFYTQGNWLHLEEHQKKLNRTPNTLYSYIVDLQGNIEVGISGLHSEDIGLRHEPWEPAAQLHLDGVTKREFLANNALAQKYEGRVRTGDRVVLISAPIIRPSNSKACAELRVAIIYESIQVTLSNLRRTLFLVGILLAFATGTIVLVTTQTKLAPVREVSRKMLELASRADLFVAELHHGSWTSPSGGFILATDLSSDAEETALFTQALTKFTSAFQQSSRLAYELQTARSTSELAAQVAHDIRSPLAALSVVSGALAQLPESQRILVRSALARIQDIANNLLDRTGGASLPSGQAALARDIEPTSVQLLSSLVDSLVSEKRTQYRGRIGITIDAKLGEQAYGLFAAVQAGEFKRVLSNLINNSVEAVGSLGQICVSLRPEDSQVVLEVEDNGCGIPAHIVPELSRRGATFEKKDGHGLGLSHAKKTFERWGGTLSVCSTEGVGTTITLVLPKASAPAWFVSAIPVAGLDYVVVADDDISIHQVWNGRLENCDRLQLVHITSPSECTDWCESHRDALGRTLLLMDYEFVDHDETGLDVIERLNLAAHSFLVTSRFEEEAILKRCEALAVKILPKSMAGYVPVVQLEES